MFAGRFVEAFKQISSCSIRLASFLIGIKTVISESFNFSGISAK